MNKPKCEPHPHKYIQRAPHAPETSDWIHNSLNTLRRGWMLTAHPFARKGLTNNRWALELNIRKVRMWKGTLWNVSCCSLDNLKQVVFSLQTSGGRFSASVYLDLSWVFLCPSFHPSVFISSLPEQFRGEHGTTHEGEQLKFKEAVIQHKRTTPKNHKDAPA